MIYYEYVFYCEKIPTRLTMHSIVTHFLETKGDNNVDCRVEKNGKLVSVKTNKKIDKENYSINLFDKNGNEFKAVLKERKEHECTSYKKGQKINVSGLIEYGVNLTNKKGKKCPFYMGKFENSDLRDKFKISLERNLGVKVNSMSREFFSRLQSERMDKHIQFNNMIELNIDVFVEDEVLFNSINYRSVFQKKTYGFGNLSIYE
jgi:hypothetical protein